MNDLLWADAKKHLDNVLSRYQSLVGVPGVNPVPAIQLVFQPLLNRYNNGERSAELYQAMRDVR